MNFSNLSNGQYDNFVLVNKNDEVFKASAKDPLYFETEDIAKKFINDMNYKDWHVYDVTNKIAKKALKQTFGKILPKNITGTNIKKFVKGMNQLGYHVSIIPQ